MNETKIEKNMTNVSYALGLQVFGELYLTSNMRPNFSQFQSNGSSLPAYRSLLFGK
jgi:hypothetical protein